MSVAWFALIIASLAAGALLVAILVVPARAEAVVAILGALTLGSAMYSVIDLGNSYQRVDALLYALGFLLAGLGAGWSLTSITLDSLAEEPSTPEISKQLPEPMISTSVIVVSCFEPERYSPRATAGMLHALAEEELLEPGISTMPFLFFAQKARYRTVGSQSPARSQIARVAERLQAALRQSPVPRVTWANCSGRERLAIRVAEAVNNGHRRIVVCEFAVGESLHLAAAIKEVDALHLEKAGVVLTYTNPLADSDPIAALLARRLSAGAGPPGGTAVVLVGHGQPEARAHLNPTLDEQENAFLNRVRLMLLEEGLPENNVRVAWAEWRQPDVTSTVRHLAALGCQRILVAPAVFPLDGLPTRLDLDMAVRHARVDERVTVVTMAAWQDEEQVIAELARRVTAVVRGS